MHIISRHEGAFNIEGQEVSEFMAFFDYRECKLCGRREAKPANNKGWGRLHCICIAGLATVREWDESKDLVAYRFVGISGEVEIVYPPLYKGGKFEAQRVSAAYFNSLVIQTF